MSTSQAIGRKAVIQRFVSRKPIFGSADMVPLVIRERYIKALRTQESRDTMFDEFSDYRDAPKGKNLQTNCFDSIGTGTWPIDTNNFNFRIGPYFCDETEAVTIRADTHSDQEALPAGEILSGHLAIDFHTPSLTPVRACEAGRIVNVHFDRNRNLLNVAIYSEKSQILMDYVHLDTSCTMQLFPAYASLLSDPSRTSFHYDIPEEAHHYTPVQTGTIIGAVGIWPSHVRPSVVWPSHMSGYNKGTLDDIVFGNRFHHLHLEARLMRRRHVSFFQEFLKGPDSYAQDIINPLFLLRPLFPLRAEEIPIEE